MIDFTPIAPAVLTAEEACHYLRLDVGRDMQLALRALTRLVDEKKLIRPVVYTKARMYTRRELDRFLDEQLQ